MVGWFNRQRITIRAAIITAIAALFGAVGQPLVSTLLDREPVGRPDVRFVDIVVDESSRGYPSLELKLRNAGGETAYVKQIELKVSAQWAIDPLVRPYFMPASRSYDIRLARRGAPYSVAVPASQVLPSGAVDRIILNPGLEPDANEPLTVYFFHAVVSLVVNEDDRTFESEPLFFTLRVPGEVLSFTTSSDWVPAFAHNRRKLREIASKTGERSAVTQDYIDAYLCPRFATVTGWDFLVAEALVVGRGCV